VAYAVSEGLVSLLAIFGNALVIYAFCTNRSLRRYRNYYIFSLAIADFLVGLLGIPLAVLASVGLPRNLYGCLFTVSVLMVLCTISILCLVAVSIDRYWATTNPFAYYRHMTTSTSVGKLHNPHDFLPNKTREFLIRFLKIRILHRRIVYFHLFVIFIPTRTTITSYMGFLCSADTLRNRLKRGS
jgi:hypothetical protein